jgi:hypothetical protein
MEEPLFEEDHVPEENSIIIYIIMTGVVVALFSYLGMIIYALTI